jgi:DNA-binding CsgD family transcriptional regulator
VTPSPKTGGSRPSDDRDTAFLRWLSPHLPPALEQVSVPSYVLDRSGRIRWLNPAARKLVGDVRGQLFTSVIDPSEVGRANTRFAAQMRGVAQPDTSVDVVGQDGTWSRVEISAVPLRSNHHAIGVFGLAVPAGRRKGAPTPDHRLTPRQREILEELGRGHSTEQIAAKLNLSRETVRNHVRHILQRLGAKSRLEAVAIAHRDGLL